MILLRTPINQLGYGTVGFNILKNFIENGQEVCYFPMGNPECPNIYHEMIAKSVQNQDNCNFNDPALTIWHQWQLENRLGRGKNTVISFFELDSLNNREINNILNHDHFIASSQWMKEIVTKHIPNINISVVPMGVDSEFYKPVFIPRPDDKPFTFLNVGKLEIRKGHDILHEIFSKAFTKEDNVQLNIAWHSPFVDNSEIEKWKVMYKESPLGEKINFIDRVGDLRPIYADADCGIFPTRAESICLPAIEMLSCNKPVIITGYSGHTEFCDQFNSYLVKIDELEQAFDGIWFHGTGNWAKIGDNQIDQFVEYMRFCYKTRMNINPNGRSRAEALDWKNVSKQISEIIK